KHADMIAQFVAPNRLLMAEVIDELDGDSEDALRLRAAERGILQAAAALHIKLEVIHVPTPPTRGSDNPRSYVNGLRLADRYLMPSYPQLDEHWDLGAWSAVQRALGDIPVVAVDTTMMIGSGGAIHWAALGVFVKCHNQLEAAVNRRACEEVSGSQRETRRCPSASLRKLVARSRTSGRHCRVECTPPTNSGSRPGRAVSCDATTPSSSPSITGL